MQGCGKAVYVAQGFYDRAVREDLDNESEELGYITRAVGVYRMVGGSTLNDSAGTLRRFIYARPAAALILCIIRYHYHLPTPQLTNLIHLATALSLDLGLNRPPKGTERHEILVEATKCRSMRLEFRERQLDERRAFLGLYWLRST